VLDTGEPPNPQQGSWMSEPKPPTPIVRTGARQAGVRYRRPGLRSMPRSPVPPCFLARPLGI